MFEVELKAKINNPEEIEAILLEKAEFIKEFDKKDYYFLIPGKKDHFRLRVEKHQNVVTIKDKSIHEGIEINKETEYNIDDVDAFIEFTKAIGSELDIIKYKKGELFNLDNYNLELCEIEGLGWFIEIEKLTENENDISNIKLKLKSILDLLGVKESQIEEEFYIDILKKKRG